MSSLWVRKSDTVQRIASLKMMLHILQESPSLANGWSWESREASGCPRNTNISSHIPPGLLKIIYLLLALTLAGFLPFGSIPTRCQLGKCSKALLREFPKPDMTTMNILIPNLCYLNDDYESDGPSSVSRNSVDGE